MLHQPVGSGQNSISVARRIEKDRQLQSPLPEFRARHLRGGQKRGSSGAPKGPVAGDGSPGVPERHAVGHIRLGAEKPVAAQTGRHGLADHVRVGRRRSRHVGRFFGQPAGHGEYNRGRPVQ